MRQYNVYFKDGSGKVYGTHVFAKDINQARWVAYDKQPYIKNNPYSITQIIQVSS